MEMEIICLPMPERSLAGRPPGENLTRGDIEDLSTLLSSAPGSFLKQSAAISENIVGASQIKSRPYSKIVALGYAIGPLLIMACHGGSLLLFRTGISWSSLAWLIGWYFVRMLAITAIYHRLLVHRSFRAPRLVLWVGCLVAASAGQMGPSWWKAHHLQHHRLSDQQGDPHSPQVSGGGWRGFVVAQTGWLVSPTFFPAKLPADVEADPLLKLLDRLHFLPLLIVCAFSYALGGTQLLAAICLSTTLLFHGVATVNSLSHLWGEQPFQTGDYSRNNMLVAHITLGEGWHNTHHAFQYSCRHGIALVNGKVRHHLDPTYGFILLLSRLGMASGLRLPTSQQILAAIRPYSTLKASTISP